MVTKKQKEKKIIDVLFGKEVTKLMGTLTLVRSADHFTLSPANALSNLLHVTTAVVFSHNTLIHHELNFSNG